MKHNKYKNVGVIFESLIYYTMKLIAEGKTNEASIIMKCVKDNFMKKTAISECYNNIYSELLYSEAINYYHAGKFYHRLLKNYNKLEEGVINAEISNLFRNLKENFDVKKIMNTKIPNYKLFSSFRIASLKENGYLSPKQNMMIDTVVLEHLTNNKELKKLSETSIKLPEYNKEQQEIDKLALALALKNFEKEAKQNLNVEQKNCLIKYYTLSELDYKKWLDKELKNMINEFCDKSLVIENENIKEKINLFVERLEKIKEDLQINEKNMTEILMGFSLYENIKLI